MFAKYIFHEFKLWSNQREIRVGFRQEQQKKMSIN